MDINVAHVLAVDDLYWGGGDFHLLWPSLAVAPDLIIKGHQISLGDKKHQAFTI
jgi:hypothetical protein